jgi:hypothetical protein
VDDILIVGANEKIVDAIKGELKERYQMVDQGVVEHYLGMKVKLDVKSGHLTINQSAYIQAVLEKFDMAECNASELPMTKPCPTIADQPAEGSSEKESVSNFDYRGLIGSLLYISICSRPDIANSVSKLAKFVANPGPVHVKAAKRVLRYLQGTKGMSLHYLRGGERGEGPYVVGYVDASHGDDDHETRKATTGYCFQYNGCTVAWVSLDRRRWRGPPRKPS